METQRQNLAVRMEVYRIFAETARRPELGEVAAAAGLETSEVAASYARLERARVLVIEEDGVSIRMAPPFSGVPTQHVAEVDGKEYFANCAWDVFGVMAALKSDGLVRSRCEQSREKLVLEVGKNGLAPSSWLFHTPVPASQWWADIVYT